MDDVCHWCGGGVNVPKLCQINWHSTSLILHLLYEGKVYKYVSCSTWTCRVYLHLTTWFNSYISNIKRRWGSRSKNRSRKQAKQEDQLQIEVEEDFCDDKQIRVSREGGCGGVQDESVGSVGAEAIRHGSLSYHHRILCWYFWMG